MPILLVILLAVAGFVALFLLSALFRKRQYHVDRAVVIEAPSQQVFDFLKLLGNQERFNKWAKNDANRKKEFRGVDGTVGFVYAWSGDKSAGQGEKEIMNLVEGKRIETEIRFVKPMRVTAYVNMELEALSEEKTEVHLINGGKLPFPLNGLTPLFERNFAKDMDESLATLKRLLEEKYAAERTAYGVVPE